MHQINTYTTTSTEKMKSALDSKNGVPDYTYYDSAVEKNNGLPSHFV